jgi:hypothetical protein
MNKAERWLVRIEPALLNIQIVEEGRAMTDGKTAIATDGAKAKRVQAKKPAPGTTAKPRERWTARKQEMFVTSLAVTGNVSLSLVETGMSQTGLYKLRKRSPAFCTAWDAALDLGYARIETMLLDRALNGRRRVLREGQIVEEFVECSDSLALSLLTQHRKRVGEYRAAVAVAQDSPDRLRGRFMVKLERLARAAGWQG